MKLPSWLGRGALAIASAATLLSTSPALAQAPDLDNGQSTFVSANKAVGFGFTVPADSNEDVFITLRVPVDREWGAVGLGSLEMRSSLILMIYLSGDGTNVTFSPRVATGHTEPAHWPDMRWEVLPGTGIVNNTFLVWSMRCTRGCRNWPGGFVNVTDPNQQAIYALGPPGLLGSDDPAASVRFHDEFGRFTINMKRTAGAADAPTLGFDAVSEGTEPVGAPAYGRRDAYAVAHAVLMLFCFVGLFPLGIVILRLGNWVRWHAANQTLALVVVLVGLALGVLSALRYERSRRFNTDHQVIGLIVITALLAQFVIGFLNHSKFKRTQMPTKLATPHVWLGRGVIFFGVVNAFLGFHLAGHRMYSYILAGLVLIVFPVCFLLLFTRQWMRRRYAQAMARPAHPSDGPPAGYDPEPWRAPPPAYSNAHGHTAPAYEAAPQSVGLADLDGSRRKERNPREARGQDLGPAAQPRELV